MEPIRVLQMTGTMNRGGAETLLMELYRHMDRKRVQFDFLVYNYSNAPGAYDDEIRKLGGFIYPMKSRLYRQPFAYQRELAHFFAQHSEYRIVHAHQYATSGYVLAAAKRKDPELYTIAHSHIAFPQTDFLRNISDNIGKWLLKKHANYFYGCSNDALIALTGHGMDAENHSIIKNAIDIPKFSFNEVFRKKWRNKIGASPECLVVGNVARFTYQKNHEHIIATFAQIAKLNPDCKLMLIGEGSKKEEIKQQVNMLKLTDRVIFLNARPDINEIINAFDVFLMPSRYEGLGIVLIEAQANGLPCVITEDVIPREADVGAGLVKRLKLSEPIEAWAQVCLNCCKRIEPDVAQTTVANAGYDIEKVAKELQMFYLAHWR